MEISIFDVLGPIMIGPSSSHTAGAAKLAYTARGIVGKPFHKVVFYLHGSFAKTYRGHGTDKALVAGVLGLKQDSEQLSDSFELAAQQGLSYSFEETELEGRHENTVRMVFTTDDGQTHEVTGSSIGGGRIQIVNIDGCEVQISGDSPTLIVTQYDKKGVINAITSVLSGNNINIAVMKLTRQGKGDIATTIIETDDDIPGQVVKLIAMLPHIISAQAISLKH